MLSFIVQNAEHHNELIVPAPFFGIAALVVLLLLLFVVFSHRDVAHRRGDEAHAGSGHAEPAVEATKKVAKTSKK